ncbi:DUF4235 domain-containing protein [Streptomyces albofaciens JCM 4342]|uniref:DUF4235 domain-containing protein n=1 Tax=Streptomyces albofaciens TaxID=66866 RepID=UPI00123C1002|nr:DUF4235 domain-containing protein [Streptomyces albofaciens]KAA6213908.1 DUF4235 domain-containing protein [Streptomyces albofaciens JCM 4342]
MIKLLYKPLGMIFGALGGVLAGFLFKRLWKLVGREEDAPKATDEERSWREVLPAAALQGATLAVVKAAVDRSGAAAVRKATGTWPG